MDTEGKETGGQVVAADAVGVGPGELVLVATGSSARQTLATQNRPCDAVIMAIVDSWEIGGVEKYKKGLGEPWPALPIRKSNSSPSASSPT